MSPPCLYFPLFVLSDYTCTTELIVLPILWDAILESVQETAVQMMVGVCSLVEWMIGQECNMLILGVWEAYILGSEYIMWISCVWETYIIDK